MKITIDYDKIEHLTGRKFDNVEQLYFYIAYVMDYLKAHNKNYNKKQYEKIDEIWEIFNACTIE